MIGGETRARLVTIHFEGGPLDGTSKTYEGHQPIGCYIVQPTMEADGVILRHEYAICIQGNDDHYGAVLRNDARADHTKKVRTMLCFKTELASLLEKYGASIDPIGHEIDGMSYTVTVDGKPFSEDVWSWG